MSLDKADELNAHSDSEGESEPEDAPVNGTAPSKKKKKKKPKKKKKAPTQSEPPRVALSKLFLDGCYPVGEQVPYLNENSWRTTSEEKRHLEQLAAQNDPLSPDNYNAIRKASEVHRQVRAYARKAIKPGMSMTAIAELVEDGTRALVEADEDVRDGRPKAGIGFPTGVSVNHCAAHYTPNAGDKNFLKEDDVLKVDFGVQVNGRIVDSAFTLTWTDKYDNLLKAVQDATNAGVREAGIDVKMADIGSTIEEVMTSYEVEVDGKTLPVKPIRNLQGHSIHLYSIHGTKSVPIVKDSGDEDRMEEGEYFAIETFGSTGRGKVEDVGECSHFAKMAGAPNTTQSKLNSAQNLLRTINKNFGTLPWCRRYLDRLGEKNYLLGLNTLVREGIVQAYPPLCDIKGSMTAQFEHTILLRPTCKEIVSRGDDY